jgi:hypothetical protein
MTDVFLAAPTAPERLKELFLEACRRPTGIDGHMTVLRDTASGLRRVTELGVGEGWSTLAWLLVQPDELLCVDLGWQACVPRLKSLAGRTRFTFWVADDRLVEIPETDLLFIDTVHDRSHLLEELRLHAGKARRYLVLHDTTTFAHRNEPGVAGEGLWDAVEQWLPAHPEWQLSHRAHHSNGLAVFTRVKP